MANKVDRLALVRMALHDTLKTLDQREKLCVLADLYAAPSDKEQPRWWGNGKGPVGLEQGFYNSMITFRRVANLWSKIRDLAPDVKLETYAVRDLLVESLGIELPQEQTNE